MIKWPDQLVSDIARRRVVIFIGSGVSRNSLGLQGKRPPIWTDFLATGCDLCAEAGVKKEIRSLIKKSDLLTACELIKEQLANQWDGLLNQEFVMPQYGHADIHETIFKLDSRIVLTQNFDKIFDTFASAKSQGTVLVKNYYDADIAKTIRGNRRLVIKVHGTIDQPHQMVFTKREYASARYHYPGFHGVLDSLMVTHTFLFLGCSLADPDIQMMLERHANIHQYANPHYIVMPGKIHPALSQSIQRNMNLELLAYSTAAEHQELALSLKQLASEVDNKRQDLTKTLDW
jgi:hypothetical protein